MTRNGCPLQGIRWQEVGISGMTKQTVRKLPKRLQIDFQHKKPVYEVWTPKGCSRRDLITAGVSEKDADALVLNGYNNKPMRYTLILPEEWFWTHRDWWKGEDGSHLTAMYELSGGSFSDLSPREQAEFLGVPFVEETGRKAKGTQWVAEDGSNVDIVRFVRGKLIQQGFDMAPAYSDGCSFMVTKTCRDRKLDPAFFSEGKTTPEERQQACQIVDEVLSRPGEVWDERPEYYFQILNTLRSIKDFDRAAMLETLRITGVDVQAKLLKHYLMHRTYENQMSHVALPPLIGRKDDRLAFFYVTQKASYPKEVSNFIRNYGLPLGLDVTLMQITAEK